MIDWQTIIETAIGSASGAAIILLISYFMGKRKEKKRDFNDAILIQLDLHQMLGVSLKVKNDYETKQICNEDIEIISSKWMLTQFLTYQRGKTRSIVKCLFDAKLSYQELQKNVGLRKANKPASDYANSIDYAIGDCFQAFKALYDYIENTFYHAIPVKLVYRNDTAQILTKQLSLSEDEVKKYLKDESVMNTHTSEKTGGKS